MSPLRWLIALVLMIGMVRAEDLAPLLFADSHGLLFTIQGSNTIGAHLAPELVAEWLKVRGFKSLGVSEGAEVNEQVVIARHARTGRKVSVEVKAHGSSSGFKAMLAGLADIAASSRPIGKAERLQMVDFGDFQSVASEYVIGLDGIAVIVHPSNSIDALSTTDVARIFSGEINNWKDLGGANRSIRVFARDEQSGTWHTFWKLVLGDSHQLMPFAERFESNATLSRRISEDPSAIGFVSLNTIGSSKPLAVSAGVTHALFPQRLTVATEDYALTRRLYFYLPGIQPNVYARDFISWATGTGGQRIVDNVGYISQNVAPLQADVSGAPESYQSLVQGNQRLSVNFRFHEGKARLDNKARMDVDRLALFLRDNPGRLLLVGFAEEAERSYSTLLAGLRAKVVRRALIRAGVSRDHLDIHGYGRYLQLSDGDDLFAKIKNRRVEVWFEPEGQRQGQKVLLESSSRDTKAREHKLLSRLLETN